MSVRGNFSVRAVVLFGLLSCPLCAVAAGADQQAQTDPQDYGVRFTPDMSRAFAGIFVKQVLKRHYELPEDKMADAEEKVARRLMQMAHKIDEPGRELIERFVEEQLSASAEGHDGGFMPPKFGKEFAERLLPIIPEIREMVRGVTQDVRPMLPMKQQLKMAGEMMAFKTGVDGFEETMKKWASGEVSEYDDPFRPQRTKKKDENGETPDLKRAREQAQGEMDKTRAKKRWKRYVEQMAKLYGFDAAQQATADSVLREFAEREQRLIADAGWRDRVYRAELWQNFSWQLPSGWMHPTRTLIEDRQAEIRLPWNDLEEAFKARLESIPTTSQRRAATEKVNGLLKEKKLLLPETQP